MNSITNILIPFDFSAIAKSALEYAVSFCKDNDHTDLTLLYISSPENHHGKQKEMKSFIDETKVPGYVGLAGKVVQGKFVETILQMQESDNIDVIIMGTKGVKYASKKAISNTSKVTLEAHCPVIVIPQTESDFQIKSITLAIGKEKIVDPTVLSVLLVIARKYDAKIHVLTILDDEDEYGLESENEAVLKYYFDKYYSFSSSTRSSAIAKSIIEYDKKNGIDMLAIIPRNHIAESSPSQGRLTKFFTMNTDIPLLTMNS